MPSYELKLSPNYVLQKELKFRDGERLQLTFRRNGVVGTLVLVMSDTAYGQVGGVDAEFEREILLDYLEISPGELRIVPEGGEKYFTLWEVVEGIPRVAGEGKLEKFPAIAIEGVNYIRDASQNIVAARFTTVENLKSDTTLGYSLGEGVFRTVVPGDVIEAGGFQYRVEPVSFVSHLDHAGGVKLRALANSDGTYSSMAFDAVPEATGLTSKVQTAIDTAASADAELVFKQGTYLLEATNTRAFAGGNLKAALDIRSNMHLRGSGKVIFKMADGQSSDASPQNFNVFFTNEYVSNISIDGIEFDLNDAGNPISPNRATGTYSRFLCATFVVSGNAAWCENVKITNCTFRNTPGTSVIVAGQHVNGFAGPMSQNFTIDGCRFINNGTDTHDHSCVFMWAENTWCQNCLFEQPAGLSKTGRNWVSYEIHGADSWFTDNVVRNFYRGCWIASNFTRSAERLFVTDNVFEVWGLGPSLFRQRDDLTEVRDVHISRNKIVLDDTVTALSIKAGIECNVLFSVKDILISENQVSSFAFDNAQQSAMVVMAGGANAGAAGDNGDIRILNNTCRGAQYGVYCRTYTNSGAFNFVEDRGNRHTNLRIASGAVAVGSLYEAHSTSPIKKVVCCDNLYQTNTSAQGVRVTGSVNYLKLDGHVYDGTLSFPNPSPYSIVLSSVAIERQEGAQINTCIYAGFPALVAGRTWTYGDVIHNISPTRLRNITHWKYDGARWWAYGTGYGSTSERAVMAADDRGYSYFDSTLGKVIIWNETTWLV